MFGMYGMTASRSTCADSAARAFSFCAPCASSACTENGNVNVSDTAMSAVSFFVVSVVSAAMILRAQIIVRVLAAIRLLITDKAKPVSVC